MTKIIKQLLFVFALCCCHFISTAQQSKMDSLNTLLLNTKQDTVRLRLYLALGDACEVEDNLKYAEPAIQIADKLLSQTKDSTARYNLMEQKARIFQIVAFYYLDGAGRNPIKHLEYLEKKLSIYKAIGDNEGMKNTISDLGAAYFRQGNIMKQLQCFQDALVMFEKLNYKSGMSRFANEISHIYVSQGDTAQALEYYEKAVKIENNINDTTRISRRYYLSGVFYASIHRYNTAFDNFNKAIKRYVAAKDTGNLANVYLRVGDAYLEKHDSPKAIEYYNKCYKLSTEINSLMFRFVSLIGSGNAYEQSKDFIKAVEFHLKALDIIKSTNDPESAAHAYSSLAKDYFEQKEYKKAKPYADRALLLMREAGAAIDVFGREQASYKIDSALGNSQGAFAHYQQFILLRDLLNGEEVRKAAAREKFQNDYDQQKIVAKVAQDKKDTLQIAEARKQKVILGAVAAGLLLVVVFAGFIFRSLRVTRKQKQIIEVKNKETEEQKLVIEEKNREVHDSITYAKRIQTAILPSDKNFKTALPNSFILYKPKDIVSGDFYWLEQINETILFAAIDCTGHGVPGAMVSVVGHGSLNRAVREFGLKQPAAILDKLTQLVEQTFDKSEDDVKDGMDISLCALNKKANTLEWAGANNPLWIIRNGELIETKANKQPIGKYEDRIPFSNHNFKLEKGDTIYVFTDGYADQFSPQDKKLMTRKFKEIVLSIQDKSMEEQKVYLGSFIENWKGNMEQTDDILVIGLKV